ncbi:hypothetical protein [Myxococcus landrumensis]|uniref:Type VI secretion system spike protein VgrG3-like C-terminal domain-containing protein n=1 Tax=Myxococcus landrumensis TaxID=2813577 RepID=A0ABX7MYL8_9BACT|nr:hypothetical protein [Myxococcus landrumus]QSQ11552.1 hypothetical protein JY572_24465 [Myxococcus landrumus]
MASSSFAAGHSLGKPTTSSRTLSNTPMGVTQSFSTRVGPRDTYTSVKSKTVGVQDVKGGYTAKTRQTTPTVNSRMMSSSFMDSADFSKTPAASLSAPRVTTRTIGGKSIGPAQSFTQNTNALGTPRAFQRDYETLGGLSRKEEAKGPGTVSTGKGDHGGVSYGSYQFASNNGSAKAFVNSLKTTHPSYHASLDGLTPGTQEFSKAWKDLAALDPKGFDKAQHDYIQRTHYNVSASEVRNNVGLDLNTRSQALRDVAWSASVQHGKKAVDSIISAALKGRHPSTVSDADLISGIYAERGRKNKAGELVHFSSSSKSVQKGITARYARESQAALERLAREFSGVTRKD